MVIGIVSLILPKGKAKVFVTTLLIIGVVASPFLYFAKTTSDTKALETKTKNVISNSCNLNEITIHKPVVAKDAFIDKRFLKMLVHPTQEGFSFDKVIRFFLTEKFESFEIQNTIQGEGNTFIGGDRMSSFILKLTIAKAPDERCRVFAKWALEYPSQTYPWLRELGLTSDSCIGLEFNENITATDRLVLAEEHIYLEKSTGVLVKYDVKILNTSSEPKLISASMIEHYSGGGGGIAGYHYGFPCGDKSNQKVVDFKKAFLSAGNDKVEVPIKVAVAPNENLTVETITKNIRLSQLRWDKTVEKVWAHNLISSHADAWVSSRYVTTGAGAPGATIGLQGYQLNILDKGKIFSTPIVISGFNSQDITGLAISKSGFALIAFDSGQRATAKRYLIEFNRQAENIATSEITLEQFNQLKLAN